ncbi:interleukin-15 receptor subunit alpha isoform X2 [Heliangelus exortis]|uniref:interleukin-15 receptor subunit alpha isoform X2 n=1 Tax=Heliangelus exortis TaxID=472823 RepID=UPI003A92FC0E
MAWRLLLLLFGTVSVPLPRAAADTAGCSHPKEVPNAHIQVGNTTQLNTLLRYTCNPGYKRKAGTSNLIQCVLPQGSTQPAWTPPMLQCIRDPSFPPQNPTHEHPDTPSAETTQKGTTNTNPTFSPSPPGLPGAPGPSPTLPQTKGCSPETSTLPEMHPPLGTSTWGEGTTLGTPLGTTPLPTVPTEYSAVSIQTVASSIVLLVLVVSGVMAFCCWRMKMQPGQDYEVAVTAIPMVAPAAGNEMLPPSTFPVG